MKNEITNAVQNLLDQLTENNSCMAIVSSPSDDPNNMEAITILHGDTKDIVSNMGAAILSHIYSDDPKAREHSITLLNLLEETLISIITYDDNIYHRFTSHLMSVMNNIKEADGKSKVKRNIPEA